MLDLIKTRNSDFLRECRRAMASTPPGKPIRLPEIARQASQSPPPRYYVSFDYALRHLRRHRRRGADTPHRGTRQLQWQELSERVRRRQQRHGIPDTEALQRELAESAPSSYFLSPSYALRLLQRIYR